MTFGPDDEDVLAPETIAHDWEPEPGERVGCFFVLMWLFFMGLIVWGIWWSIAN